MYIFTKSLCNSLLICGVIFMVPMKMKNNPNKIERLLSTIDVEAIITNCCYFRNLLYFKKNKCDQMFDV